MIHHWCFTSVAFAENVLMAAVLKRGAKSRFRAGECQHGFAEKTGTSTPRSSRAKSVPRKAASPAQALQHAPGGWRAQMKSAKPRNYKFGSRLPGLKRRA